MFVFFFSLIIIKLNISDLVKFHIIYVTYVPRLSVMPARYFYLLFLSLKELIFEIFQESLPIVCKKVLQLI